MLTLLGRENIRIMGIPEGEEEIREFKEVIAKDFPNLVKELNVQVHEAKRSPNYLSAKKTFSKTHYIKTVRSQ